MRELADSLEQVARAARGPAEKDVVLKAVRKSKSIMSALHVRTEMLKQLIDELAVWEKKVDAILSDPAGRQGMAKHAAFWADRVRKM